MQGQTGRRIHETIGLEPGIRLRQGERREFQAGKGLKKGGVLEYRRRRVKKPAYGEEQKGNMIDWINDNWKIPARRGQCTLVERRDMKRD